MKSNRILSALVISLSCVPWFSVCAQQVDVHVAWEHRITNINFTAMLPDNLGNLAVVGTRDEFVTAVLLDTNGLLVSARASCSRAPVGGVIATTDSAGRIFAAAPEQFTNQLENNRNVVHCVRFEPLLGAATNLADMSLGSANIVMQKLLPDENGGVYASLNWYSIAESYVSLLKFSSEYSQYLGGVFHGSSYPGVRGGDLIPIGSGGFYVVGSGWDLLLSRYSSSAERIWQKTFSYYKGGLPAAAADSEGNLVFVVGYRVGTGGPNASEVVKVDPQGNVLWRIELPDRAYGIAPPLHGIDIGPNGEVLISGEEALIKFNASGQQLWTSTNSGRARFSRSGEIVLWRRIDNYIVLMKLNADGSVRWQSSPHHAGTAEIVLGSNDEVYVALPLWSRETAIFKYNERDFGEAVQHETIDAPQPNNCPVPEPPKPDPVATTTLIRGGKVAVCWPTNYCDYTLQAARHLNKRDPNRTKWVEVEATIATNGASCCTTNRIARYGRNYRIVPLQ